MSSERSCYAVSVSGSRGRRHFEQAHRYRNDFERDRDRIIHSSAFRRLEGKTQVFTPGLDDYYRTRLTHSIEVSQIGRTIARALGLNEELTEAICLAHDLGHSPFGHTGEQVLDELMVDHGGFEHNRQSLRIVDLLEHPYAAFAGLNLMYETRLGLARHSSPYDKSQADGFEQKNCSLEGQVADIADRIAYNCHDLEDGMRAGVIGTEQLREVVIFREIQEAIKAAKMPDRTIRRTRTAKAIIEKLVSDCIDTSGSKIKDKGIDTVEDVYNCGEYLIVLSKENEQRLCEMEEFLLNYFYKHESVTETMKQVRGWLGSLFENLCGQPESMPGYYQGFINEFGLQRAVCDYIAGMTDGFCLNTLKKINTGNKNEL
jgi:dGTPase